MVSCVCALYKVNLNLGREEIIFDTEIHNGGEGCVCVCVRDDKLQDVRCACVGTRASTRKAPSGHFVLGDSGTIWGY